MARFSIENLDKYLVYKIFEKLNAKEFTKLIRTCKDVKNLIEEKSNWKIMVAHVTLIYTAERRMYIAYKDHNLQRIPTDNRTEMDAWFCCENITFQKCSPSFFREEVIPEVRRLRGIKVVELNYEMEEEELKALSLALHQPKVKYNEMHYKEDNAHLEKFEKIEVEIMETSLANVATFLGRVFRLLRGRKDVILNFPGVERDIVLGFLKNWLRGKSIETIGRLTFDFMRAKDFSKMKVDVLRSLAVSPDYQNYIFEMNSPGESGNTMSENVVISRNPRYGEKKRLSLQFMDQERVVFEFLQ